MQKTLLSAVTIGVLLLVPTPGATLPDAAVSGPAEQGKQTAIFAGGCFWCTEAVFEPLTGVDKVVSGYAGGDAKSADYRKVSSGQTNHAEVIEITYDPKVITYAQLLKVFFAVAHDPTQLNYQGPDHGRQYRSAIFYRTPEQKNVAEKYIKQLTDAKAFPKPIVTELTQLTKFYPAEEYHQDFVRRNPDHPYVMQWAVPKIKKLKAEFSASLKKR
ncbi:MAG TPA: peptide-methionine (S)-S-oxide reductase MsrA [Bryobacteraceae bacterium]|nr:peptide-methionine (S)-S-oxide reductase MsrA [Bryobacteraceae bacterium]